MSYGAILAKISVILQIVNVFMLLGLILTQLNSLRLALHFHSLKVKEIVHETTDCVSILFEVPDELKTQFAFKQGQSIAIKSHFDDVRRSFSICSSPLEKELRVAVKKVPNGVFSSYANEKLQAGDVLDIMPPTGSFYTEVVESNKKNYVFFAAGSGITPIISIIKTILFTERLSNITLIYSNKDTGSIIFKEDLQSLKDQYIDRFRILFLLSREQTEADINYGRIDESKLHQLSKIVDYQNTHEFFICGPEEMIFTVNDFLTAKGIGKENIHFELFTTPTRNNIAIFDPVAKESAEEAAEGAELSIKVDGLSYDLHLGYDEQTILDAGLDEGIDLPYACKGGVCCSCKAKLIEGEVEMEVNYGLEDSEILDGYILTCQSHPRTPKVVVDFDA